MTLLLPRRTPYTLKPDCIDYRFNRSVNLAEGNESFIIGHDFFDTQKDVQGNLYPTLVTPTVAQTYHEDTPIIQAPYVWGAFGGYTPSHLSSIKTSGITYIGQVRNVANSQYTLLANNNAQLLRIGGRGDVDVAISDGVWTNQIRGNTPIVTGITAGDFFNLAITHENGTGTLVIRINGVSQTITYTANATTVQVQIPDLMLFEDSSGWISSALGFEHFSTYSRALSESEQDEYFSNTYSLLEEPTKYWVVPSAATGPVGTVAETDTVLPVTARESKVIGTTTETDTVQAVSARIALRAGPVTEADTIQPITARESATLGLITETDTVQATSARESLAVGVATETDTVQAASASESLAVSTVTETDVLVALPGVSPVVGTVTETDTIQSITARETAVVGPVTETDAVLPSAASESLAVGVATETDTVQAASASESLAVGTVAETDVLVALPTTTPGLVGTVTETDALAPISARQAHAVGVISEADALASVSPALGRQVGPVTEADVVLSVFASSAFTVGLVSELDTVIPLAGLDVYRYPTPGAVLARPDLAGPDLSRPTIAAQLTSTIEVSND